MKTSCRWASGLLLSMLCWPAWCTPPVLYENPAYESPVRADPGDLLVLAGYGFAGSDRVVYSAIANTTQPLQRPGSIPEDSGPSLGSADVVSVVDAPYSLTIHLPANLLAGQSYALWVVNAAGEWSNGLRINDARPLWIAPSEVYSTAQLASLPRVLKVVGRNLQAAPGATTQVRLSGPGGTYTLPAATFADAGATLERYVAQVSLPATIVPGTYSVLVSRDGTSWVGMLAGSQGIQQLAVRPDPTAAPTFAVSSFGCQANDGNDHTSCVVQAIAAAQAAGGGTVVFGPGTWNLVDPGTWASGSSFSNKGVTWDGVVVPVGVNLAGAGSGSTTVVRGANWGMITPTFALQGSNVVSGFTFHDARVYVNTDWSTSILQIGLVWYRAQLYHASDPSSVSHVTITQNVFDKPYFGVALGALPTDHVYITYNTFGAYRMGLFFADDPASTSMPFHYIDSVIAYNRFEPGSYVYPAIVDGTVASSISGTSRTDFSNNVADGTSTAFLYNPATDARGWRAANFWVSGDNAEMLLISQNTATCTGDKAGDGEAFTYDNNHNITAFESGAVPVLSAVNDPGGATSTLVMQGAPLTSQTTSGRTLPIPSPSWYVGDWVQLVQGPGVGQARKVVAVSVGSNAAGATTALTVAPALDVLPDTTSSLTLGRLFWQTYIVNNTVDGRKPLCLKSNQNPDRLSAGVISFYAQTADSAIEGNTQYDTGGIQLMHQFAPVDPAAGLTSPQTMVKSFNEVRGNFISGAYAYGTGTLSGIHFDFAAAPDVAQSPVIAFGESIAHNTIVAAGGSHGAIALDRGWYVGPIDPVFNNSPWKVAEATLIFDNTLTDAALAGTTGIGISAGEGTNFPFEWHTVLSANVCNGQLPATLLADQGTATYRYCASAPAGDCACTSPATDLQVRISSAPNIAGAGTAVTYSLAVTNAGNSAATNAALSIDPAAGLSLSSISSTISGVLCDPSLGLCQLGTIAPGAMVPLTVSGAVGAASMSVQPTFSVTHGEADPRARNDSARCLQAVPSGGRRCF